MSIGCNQGEQIVRENMSLMGYNRVSSLIDCHTYDKDVELRVNSAMVTQLVMLVAENFADILVQNDDVDELVEDDLTENYSSLLGGEYEVSFPLYKELNWDVINAMNAKTLTSCSGLWNESNELYKGLRFENKADLQYVLRRYSIHRNQHFVSSKFNPNLWAIKCKKSSEGCKLRICVCRRKTHGMFEIKKNTSVLVHVSILNYHKTTLN